MLLGTGFVRSETPENANIIIINTCGFIEDAKKESIDVIFEAVQNVVPVPENNQLELSGFEKNRDNLFRQRIVVIGCLSERYREDIQKDIPEIDLVYGIYDDSFIGTMVKEFNIELSEKRQNRPSPLVENLSYSYIKISEGCSNNCSYCAIPLIRGPLSPYPAEAILDRCRQAVEDGAAELIFVAQDTASYHFGKYRLPDLINSVSRIPGVQWIRLMYFHPDNINSDIIKLMRANAAVVKYIDIPFQHVSRRILKSMGRKGDAQRYEELVAVLRAEVPNIRIRSTFMVGYPGETDEEFDELINFITSVKLDRVGCFQYSQEEDTRAAKLGGQVHPEIMQDRWDHFMQVQKEISHRRLRELVGTEVRVMVEEKTGDKSWLGRSEYDAPEVDGIFYLTAQDVPINSICTALVTDALDYDLVGVIR